MSIIHSKLSSLSHSPLAQEESTLGLKDFSLIKVKVGVFYFKNTVVYKACVFKRRNIFLIHFAESAEEMRDKYIVVRKNTDNIQYQIAERKEVDQLIKNMSKIHNTYDPKIEKFIIELLDERFL